MLKARRAFTTIELLTAIGILVVLVGIVMFGMRSLGNTGKLRATHLALENCRALVAEREAVSGLGSGPATWVWQGGNFGVATPAAGINYWKNPGGILDAPGSVKEPDGHAVRNGSRAVLNTTLIMGLLAAVPANRTALSKIPKEQLFTPEWIEQTALPGPGADGVLNTNDDASEQVLYAIGTRVKDGSNYFICTVNHASAARPAPPANWNFDSLPVPIMKDGWNNPIIFVPANGLLVRMLKDKKANDPADPTQTQLITSPDNRPFFASAGPDGDFNKGDDNVYSFEQ